MTRADVSPKRLRLQKLFLTSCEQPNFTAPTPSAHQCIGWGDSPSGDRTSSWSSRTLNVKDGIATEVVLEDAVVRVVLLSSARAVVHDRHVDDHCIVAQLGFAWSSRSSSSRRRV